MQTLRVLQTINWIKNEVQPIREMLFELLPLVLRQVGHEPTAKRPPEISRKLLEGLHASGAVLADLRKNPDAIAVLDTFDCARLHDSEYIQHMAEAGLLENIPKSSERTRTVYSEYHEAILGPWHTMVSCVEPLTKLIVPDELKAADTPKDDVLTVELSDRPQLNSASIIEILKATSALYDAVVEIHKYPSDPPLTVLKIESGTGFTVSFKGVADIVREMKNFVIEIWNKNRHKRADEIVNQNRAVGSSIQILTTSIIA